MIEAILGLVNGIVFGLFLFYIGNIIYNKKFFFTKKNLFALLIYIIGYELNILFFTSIFSIFFYYILIVIYYRIVFQEDLSKTLLGALLAYLSRTLIELLFIVLGLIYPEALYICNYLSVDIFILHMVTVIIDFILILLFRKKLKKIIKYIDNIPTKQFLIFFIIYFVLFVLIFIRVPNFVFNSEAAADFIVIFLLTVVCYLIINKEHETTSVNHFYEEVSIYSKLGEALIQEYRMVLHEYKNQLAIINQMIDGDKDELRGYVNSIIKVDQELKYEWLSELSYISISAWKGFLSYKVVQMKEKGIFIELIISPEISKIHFDLISNQDKNDLYMITGILLDNARDAAIESLEKIISIHLYCDKSSVYFEIANTYKGSVDLERINDYGFSSKGTEHGTGLYIIKVLLDKNSFFKLNTSVLDEYFVQRLQMDFSQLTENHKKKTVYHKK